MSAWIESNFTLGTLAVAALLVLVCALIIRKLISDKRAGRLACGGNCASCAALKGGGCMSCTALPEEAIREAIAKNKG